ncbi:MAG: sensor histidine kinase [Williamsia sp.]|nr:sensor histidine kinase [Williamsia sp.]
MLTRLLQQKILMHVFFFTLFLIIPTLAFVRKPGEPLFPLSHVFLQDTVANCVLLGFFYLNYYILIPRYFLHRKYFLYLCWVILFLGIALTLPHLIGRSFMDQVPDGPFERGGPDGDFPHHGPGQAPSLFHSVILEFRRHVSLFFSAVFFSFLLKTREHVSLLKEEKLETELTSLKSQINPHFLFNTLNTIYALSVKKDDRASEAIINLAGLMRYVIKDANDYKIHLQLEIDYINNYIELQKARLGNTTAVGFACVGEPGNKKITPLILITFIENAFKYGVNPDVEKCIIEIGLHITDTGIRLDTLNKKVPSIAHENSTGIGMKNTTERLKHLYPGKHNLQIVDGEETYSVTLILDLT